MPTDTFVKLPEEKKQKIIIAAKKEFSRVPLEEASIKNIVEEAEIARGSFYQYFESKEDLLHYIVKEDIDKMEIFIKEKLQETKGDIFAVYIAMYDYATDKILNNENFEFHKRILENAKAGEESSIILKTPNDLKGPFQKLEFLELIDTSKLRLNDEEDIKIVIKMLFLITRKAMINNFKYKSTKEAREEYIKMINYLKQGVTIGDVSK